MDKISLRNIVQRAVEICGVTVAPTQVVDVSKDELDDYTSRPAGAWHFENSFTVVSGDAGSVSPDTLREGVDLSAIKAAVSRLDPEDNEHWTSKGLPSVDAVEDLCGFDLSRRHIEAAVSGFTRKEAGGE